MTRVYGFTCKTLSCSLVLFENLTERENKKFQECMECGDYLYILGPKKKKKMVYYGGITKEVMKFPANERGTTFSPSSELAWGYLWNYLWGIITPCTIHLY